MMTETLVVVEPHEEEQAMAAAFVGDQPPRLVAEGEPAEPAERVVLSRQEAELLRGLVRRTRGAGGDLTGPGGLLKQLTKTVIESALEEELVDHLGYDKHDPAGRNGANSSNGYRSKTVVTDTSGEVVINVPRDREGSFEPRIVAKRQRRLTDLDTLVISLYAKGLTTGEISAHLFEVYGANVGKDTISRITDKIVEEMQAWWARPLEKVYAAIFIDAIMVKVRDGQVANQPFYAAIGVDLDGHNDILGIWAGGNGDGESPKYWLNVLTELRNRGVRDVFFLICDGLKGLPDSVAAAFPKAIVQTSSVHHGGGGMVPLLGCTVTVRTYANEHRGRSTCRPVRRWRGRPGIDWPAGSSTFECRDEVPGNRARRAGCRPSAAEGAAWSRRCPPRRSSVLTGAAANINCARLMTPGKC